MSLPLKLADLRKEAGFTQTDLAEKLDVSRQAVSKWEVGTAVPGIDSLKALSELYGVSIDYLLNDDLLKPPAPAGNPVQVLEEQEKQVNSKKSRTVLIWVIINIIILAILVSIFSMMSKQKQVDTTPMEDMSWDANNHPVETFNIEWQ